MERIVRHFVDGFEDATASRGEAKRRVGSELKFPIVNARGEAAPREAVAALWAFLEERGWQPVADKLTGKVVGARKRGPQNDTLASCETGYCKTEFSLAHVANLHELDDVVGELRESLRDFSDREGVYFLGYGIQPVTPPSKRLLIKKGRTAFWGKVFKSNRKIDPSDGDDVHLFTINASSQVHIDVCGDNAIGAVNTFNGLTAAQIALTADSSVWQDRVDPDYKCVCEMFWDWWMPQGNRVGVPPHPFRDMEHYVHTIARLRPIYVKRDGKPVGVMGYKTFAEYYQAGEKALGTDARGNTVPLRPCDEDIDQHGTFYWYNARISRYYTLENRVNDQQPPDDLMCVPALTLGLAAALPEARQVVEDYPWEELRAARAKACEQALDATAGGLEVHELARRMLEVAQGGLQRRRLGEERYLAPLWQRLEDRRCPADDAAEQFRAGGAEQLVRARRL
ncbi:MAG: hypothetical protein ACLF0G_01220 [Candidatus Brocadiia bacterium]